MITQLYQLCCLQFLQTLYYFVSCIQYMHLTVLCVSSSRYFKIPIGFDELKDYTLGFYLYNYDRFSHNELMGEVKIDFNSIDVTTVVEVWCDVEPSSQVGCLLCYVRGVHDRKVNCIIIWW